MTKLTLLGGQQDFMVLSNLDTNQNEEFSRVWRHYESVNNPKYMD